MAQAGDALTHFRLVEKLGEGGMGAVWRAVDTKLDREVALKILPAQLSDDPARRARFQGEARAVAALNHPNIVTIHSVEQSGDVHFLALELVSGRRLDQVIPPGGLTLERFLALAGPIVDAVAAAHERGLSHRDLKPGNVMITHDDRVKILDFGLAQFRENDSDRDPDATPTITLTQTSEIRGTLPYMSPEQVQGKPLDGRSDIFSLGAVLYEMATGRRAFQGETAADLVAAILRDTPRPLTECNGAMPRELQRIVAHCLQKDRERRLQTALDLRNRLAALGEETATLEVPTPPGVPARPAAPQRKSLAVLPLENHSGDPTQEFFADGMTEALITDLAKIGALKVISRTSVMRFKGTTRPLREIARELGVGAVVVGSVLRAGGRVRIAAQLIDAATDEHLWAERYDRDLTDVLALQADVARTIAEQVEVQLSAQESARLATSRPVKPEAHEACLHGRYLWNRRTPEAVRKGLSCFEDALRLDPAYAPAWAGVADSFLLDGGRYLGVAPAEAYARAREAALRAVELDDGLAEAHNSLAAVLGDFDWRWDEAERAFRRALELNPSYVAAHQWFADHLVRVGRLDEALVEARLARDIDPLSPLSPFFVAWVLYFSRRYGEALEQVQATLELDRDHVPAQRLRGWILEELGRHEEAIGAHARAGSLSGDDPAFRGQLGRAYAVARRDREARFVLGELLEAAKHRHVSSVDLAVLLAELGDVDAAFGCLGRACDERAEALPYVRVSPRLDRLRSDPRFAAIVERVGL